MVAFSRLWSVSLCLSFEACLLFGQANGKLQIHFMDVGQGDGAILVSPQGEVVLFDNGVEGKCDRPVSYLRQLGVKKIDYHIATHYHADHIGCTTEVLREFPLQKDALDRGGQYDSATYREYVTSVGSHRKTAEAGMHIMLDAGTTDPVEIRIVALNGDGVRTTNENDLSVVSLVLFGGFHAEIGGDLSGYKMDDYEDIETGVAGKVNQIEVYKVHHHGSQYSSNGTWLSKTKPMVGVISVGDGNGYGHPTQECLDRLHAANVKVYWTEMGTGALPIFGKDIVGGNIVVQTGPGGQSFSVTHNGILVDNYGSWEAPGPSSPRIYSAGVVGAGLAVPPLRALSPNGIMIVSGENFAPAGTIEGFEPVDGKLPTSLAGVCVMVGSTPAPIFAVVAIQVHQVYFQVPLIASSGPVEVRVVTGCGTADERSSSAELVTAQAAAPEFFYFKQNPDGKNPIAALNASSGVYVGSPGLLPAQPSAPAKPGDIVRLFLTGLGTTSPQFAPGVLPDQAAPVSGPVQVTLGGIVLGSTEVLCAGVVPQIAGLYELDIRIPDAVADGDQPVVVSVGGFTSPSGGFLTIQR